MSCAAGWQIKREGGKKRIMCVLHRTFHYQMSQPGWLPEPTLSSSFFPSRSSISTPSPFLPSTSVRAAKKRRGVLHQLSGPSAWCQTPPSLSLSPLSSSLLLSSPCCDRAHLLDLGYTRSESNYLAATSQSHPPDWIFGSRSHLSSLCLDSAENR